MRYDEAVALTQYQVFVRARILECFCQVDSYWVFVWNIELLKFYILGTFG